MSKSKMSAYYPKRPFEVVKIPTVRSRPNGRCSLAVSSGSIAMFFSLNFFTIPKARGNVTNGAMQPACW